MHGGNGAGGKTGGAATKVGPLILEVPADRATKPDPKSKDWTFYLSDTEFTDAIRHEVRWAAAVVERAPVRVAGDVATPLSYEATAEIRDARSGERQKARVVVCRVEERALWSVTCRQGGSSGGYAYSVSDMARLVWGCLEPHVQARAAKGGLLIVAGGTGSGKSAYAQELCHQLVALHPERQHLVSVEDPIETRAWFGGEEQPSPNDSDEATKRSEGACLDSCPDARWRKTMRHRRIDTESVRAALMGTALRQTPGLVIVGEVRDDEDWQAVVEFSCTGHFCVVTTHAGSLTMAVSRLIRALGLRTPADRAYLADSLLGVLHLAVHTMEKPAGKVAQLPALWVPLPRSAGLFAGSGLRSLVAETSGLGQGVDRDASGVYGHHYFMESAFGDNASQPPGELVRLFPNDLGRQSQSEAARCAAKAELLKRAYQLDERGL